MITQRSAASAMRLMLSILAAALLLPLAAHGAIGESEGQIQRRYGVPVTVLPARPDDPGLTKCYSSHGFSVAVTYLEGRSVRETMIKKDDSEIASAEIQKLLEADAKGAPQEGKLVASPTIVTPGVQEWRSADGRSRVALYDSRTRALFITTQNFISLTGAKMARAARIERSDKRLRDRISSERGASRALTQDVRGPVNGAGGFGGGQGGLQPSATPAK
ncbi:MAG: hypothetical protein ACR2G0_05410 [Chthoniobacterales bacterium]